MRIWAEQNPGLKRLEYNPALAAMEMVIKPKDKQRVAVETGSVLMIARTAKLSEELGFDPVIVATGQEWRRPEILKKYIFDYYNMNTKQYFCYLLLLHSMNVQNKIFLYQIHLKMHVFH